MKLALMLSAVILISYGCNKSSFTQPGERVPAQKPDVKVERFSLASKETRTIDMVWVIDNSGSMLDEIELVRQNFGSFVTSVSSFSDLRLGLIGADTSRSYLFGIDLHFLAPNTDSQQFPINVGSTNALSIIASAVCDEGSTTVEQSTSTSPSSPVTVCNTAVGPYVEEASLLTEIRGKLKPFFRENSKKVFVVVTDDNARAVDQSNFLNIINTHLPQQEVYVFGFVGQTKTPSIPPSSQPGARACSIANVGSAYIDLATKTNARTYDICEADWSQHFKDLTKNVEDIVNMEFVLNTNQPFKLLEILVDGKLLPEGAFKVENNRIVLLDRSLVQGAEMIEVKYSINR